MRGTKSRRWKPLLAACVIALLVLPAAASAHMEWAETPTGYYADMPAIAMTGDGRIADAKTIMLLQWAALHGPFAG